MVPDLYPGFDLKQKSVRAIYELPFLVQFLAATDMQGSLGWRQIGTHMVLIDLRSLFICFRRLPEISDQHD